MNRRCFFRCHLTPIYPPRRWRLSWGDESKTREDLLRELEGMRGLVSELNAARDHGCDAKRFSKQLERREGHQGHTDTDDCTLIDGEYSFKDLVDMESLRKVLEKFSSATGFPTGFVCFPTQEVLIATGWKEICMKFHRAFPESARHCRESNTEITTRLTDLKQLNIRVCGNGMVDGATPVIVEDKHVASLFTGQCLFEEPDVDRFRKQSATNGFDVNDYMEALSRVKVVSRKEFEAALSFLGELAGLIAEQGLSRLKLKRRTWKLEREITHLRGAQDSLQEARNALVRRVEKLKKELTETDEQRKKEIAERLDVEEALRKSEMNLAAAQKIAQIGHWTLDPETGEVEGSDELFRILGLTREEATLNAFVEAVHRDDREYYLRHIRRGMEHGESWDIEHRLIRKDGTQKWVHARGEAVVDGTGKTVQLQGTAQEITERKRVEVELRQSERRHRTLFERARDAIMIIDIEGDNLVPYRSICCQSGHELWFDMVVYPARDGMMNISLSFRAVVTTLSPEGCEVVLVGSSDLFYEPVSPEPFQHSGYLGPGFLEQFSEVLVSTPAYGELTSGDCEGKDPDRLHEIG